MDYYNAQPQQQKTEKNPFATAALVLGILSLLSISTIIVPVFCGSLAILFAILSKGKNRTMESIAGYGVFSGLGALLLTLFISATSVWMYFYNEDYRNELNSTFEEIYGITFEQYTEEMLEYYNTGDTSVDEEVDTL